MLSVRICPQCGAVCSTSGAQCASCGLEEGHAPVAPQVPSAAYDHRERGERRVGVASRGVWQMIVDALLHGHRPSLFGRRAERDEQGVQQVLREHVAHPAVVAPDPLQERVDNIA